MAIVHVVVGVLWSENWGNIAATKQTTTYNVELMRSAALKRGETLGHYLIAYSNRLPWDLKLHVASQVARDVKVLQNFWYGPSWAGHEGGQTWKSTAWYRKPEHWYANAEMVYEIGGAEELLHPAKKARSPVGILYSSSADIWTLDHNHAYGFDRMFLWLALTHQQIPVDFLSERMVMEGELDTLRVCYLTGTNLSRVVAERLVDWVKRGGTLVVTAGAALRDEFNQPLEVLNAILPAEVVRTEDVQPFLHRGNALHVLRTLETVRIEDTTMQVFSVKQKLAVRQESVVLGTYSNGEAAYVSGRYQQGYVYQYGFLPGIAYMRPALMARRELERKAGKSSGGRVPDPATVISDELLLQRSQSPWQYPQDIRQQIVMPVQRANVSLPIQCNTPLVDAVLMESDKGAVVPLANYTLQPIQQLSLQITTRQHVVKAESIHHGELDITRIDDTCIHITLPLQETDYLLLWYAE